MIPTPAIPKRGVIISLLVLVFLITVTFVDGIQSCQIGEKACTSGDSKFKATVLVIADHWACQAFGGDEISTRRNIMQLLSNVSQIYRRATCLTLQDVFIDIKCDEESDPFKEFVRFSAHKDLHKNLSEKINEDYGEYGTAIKLFITGFAYNLTQLGIANKRAMCAKFNNLIWMQQFDPWVFAHYLGLLLNAKEVDSGVMRRPVLGLQPELFLANESASEISNFLDNIFTDSSKRCCLAMEKSSPPPSPPPTPTPTSTSTPTATPTPSISAKVDDNFISSCEKGFSEEERLRCRKGEVLGNVETHFGNVRISVVQSYNNLTVNGIALPEEKKWSLREFSAFLTYREHSPSLTSLSSFEPFIAEKRFFGRGRTRARVHILPGQMISSPEWSTCCSQAMRLDINVVAIRFQQGTTNTAKHSMSFRYTVRCSDPCRFTFNGISLPADESVGRRCPVCL